MDFFYTFNEKISRSEAIGWIAWCTPGTGVNLWGESPLYLNPVNVKKH